MNTNFILNDNKIQRYITFKILKINLSICGKTIIKVSYFPANLNFVLVLYFYFLNNFFSYLFKT